MRSPDDQSIAPRNLRPQGPRRRSPRLRDYDYTASGAYFVTICVHDRAHLLGKVRGRGVIPSSAGEMVALVWKQIPTRLPSVEVDEFVVMPDHLHGILLLDGSESDDPRLTVGTIVGRFKSLTTRRYIAAVEEQGWPRFVGRLWQRGFHDHVIRNEDSLNQIREYIRWNPVRWTERYGP